MFRPPVQCNGFGASESVRCIDKIAWVKALDAAIQAADNTVDQIEVRTATTSGGLGSASYRKLSNGASIGAGAGEVWLQIKITFHRSIPDFMRADHSSKVWLGESASFENRHFAIPDIQSLTPSYTIPSYEQAAYRWFNNADSTDVGEQRAVQDVAAPAPVPNIPFRLRALLHIGVNQMAVGTQQLKLQFAVRSGVCDTGFAGETYTDLAPGSGALRYYNNSAPADAAALTANSSDPTHSGHVIVNQSYEESNNFTNLAAIPVGQDGKWDFSLIDFSAPPSTTYCLRIVKADGTLLDTYSQIPQITTAPGPDEIMRHSGYFLNETEQPLYLQ